MKQILWFSVCMLNSGINKVSGSWLYSMARLLTESNDIVLTNITMSNSVKTGEVKHIKINDNFQEYILPNWKLDNNGIPDKKFFPIIKKSIEEVSPDLIHVWGVESWFSKVIPLLDINIPILLEIQGLHSTCARVYYGDMSIRDTLRCFGLREFLFPFKKSVYHFKNNARKKGKLEYESIKKYKNISTQSRWIKDHIRSINSDAKIFTTGMSIRKEFWKSGQWTYPTDGSMNFYFSSAGPLPYKSVQTAIKALAEVVKIHSNAKLYIVGNFKDSNWIHQNGYLTFIKKIIKRLDLEKNIIFTGSLDAHGIAETMHKCIGMVQTSYVESYSLVVAESQSIGLPCIISYAGAMPELAIDRESGLFYSPGDYYSCAARMLEIIENKELANRLSQNAYELAHQRNNDDIVLAKQLDIYNEIIQEK